MKAARLKTHSCNSASSFLQKSQPKANRLLTDPLLKQLLQGFTRIDLRVANRGAFFADWGGQEWIARCGGKMRAAKVSISPRGLEIMRAYHNDIAELICTVVRLATQPTLRSYTLDAQTSSILPRHRGKSVYHNSLEYLICWR